MTGMPNRSSRLGGNDDVTRTRQKTGARCHDETPRAPWHRQQGTQTGRARCRGQGREGRRAAAFPPISPGKAQADELKDFLKHLETLEKEGARKVEGLSGEGDSVIARLEKLDLAGIQPEAGAPASARDQPEPAPSRPQVPKREDDFVALIRGIEEVKRDLVPDPAGKTVVRREIKAEKVESSGDKQARNPPQAAGPGEGEAEYSLILDRLQKLDLTNVGGETKADIDDIATWKKELRKDPDAASPREPAPPKATRAPQGVDTESILKRLEGLTPPAEPKAAVPRAKAAPREAPSPQPVRAVQPSQGVDAETILKRLEELTPEEAKTIAQKVAAARKEAPSPQPARVAQPSQGVDAEAILKRLEGLNPEEAKTIAQKVTAAPREAAPPQPALQAAAEGDTQSILKQLEGIAPADQRVPGKSKWEAAAPAKEEPRAEAAEGSQTGSGKNGSEKDVTSVIDTIFKVHKGSPMGVPTEDVDASLKQIIEEETQAGAAGDEEREAVHAKKTRWSDGEQEGVEEAIVSVDEIKDISNLILPKGATFAIDEVKLHERTAVFDVKTGVVPSEMVESWQSQPALRCHQGYRDREGGRSGDEGKGALRQAQHHEGDPEGGRGVQPAAPRPPRGSRLPARPEYRGGGGLPGERALCLHPGLHDNSTHEYTYQVLEPVLNPAERELIGELKQRLFETLEVNTKDLHQGGGP